jgi:hypothetical protein
MGEYATYKGQQIKIGTCEDMYYLRPDQARMVQVNRSHGDTDVIGCADAIRFRFPFPDEDSKEPGSFEDYGRAVTVHGVMPPDGVEHYNVQFRADAGYLLSIPCPEGAEGAKPGLETEVNGLRIHRNGFRGSVRIVQQRVWNGRMALVTTCGGCGSKWRYETLEDARPVIDACLAEGTAADRREWQSNRCPEGGIQPSSTGDWWREIAARIEAGYTKPLPWQVS